MNSFFVLHKKLIFITTSVLVLVVIFIAYLTAPYNSSELGTAENTKDYHLMLSTSNKIAKVFQENMYEICKINESEKGELKGNTESGALPSIKTNFGLLEAKITDKYVLAYGALYSFEIPENKCVVSPQELDKALDVSLNELKLKTQALKELPQDVITFMPETSYNFSKEVIDSNGNTITIQVIVSQSTIMLVTQGEIENVNISQIPNTKEIYVTGK